MISDALPSAWTPHFLRQLQWMATWLCGQDSDTLIGSKKGMTYQESLTQPLSWINFPQGHFEGTGSPKLWSTELNKTISLCPKYHGAQACTTLPVCKRMHGKVCTNTKAEYARSIGPEQII